MKWTAKIITQNQQKRIAVYFKKNINLINLIPKSDCKCYQIVF